MTAADRTRLPSFVICGAQKSGTTSLHRYLEQHPQIFLPHKPQETHFFDLDANYEQGVSWYAQQFAARTDEQVVGQTSPLYMFLPHVPQRMHELLPQARLIFLLRNPVDRAYSHYWHQCRFGREPLSFEAALKAEPQRIARDFEHLRRYSYASRGRYVEQVRRFLEHYPLERMLLLSYDRFSAEPVETLRAVCRFIGVETEHAFTTQQRHHTTNIPRSQRWRRAALAAKKRKGVLWRRFVGLEAALNTRRGYPALHPETRQRLTEQFRPLNDELSALTGLDVSGWR